MASGADVPLVPLHWTPAVLAKAKALGVVAAALTAGGAGGMIALSQVSMDSGEPTVVINAGATTAPTAEPTESPTDNPAATDQPTATPEATAPAATPSAYALPSCPADVRNHGGYVSSVAHSAPKASGGEHGSWVSQAAHSDCGTSHTTVAPKPSSKPKPASKPKPKPAPTHAARTVSPDPSSQAKPPETHATTSVPSTDAPDTKHVKVESAPEHGSNHDH